MTDAEHYHRLERLYAAAPISQWYGATIAVAEGQAEVRIATRPEFHHPAHAVHGSVYFRALDDAAFFAVNSRVREVLVLTVSFTVHFARPVTSGELRAVGRLLHGSGHLFLAEADLLDGEGLLLGRGGGVFLDRERAAGRHCSAATVKSTAEGVSRMTSVWFIIGGSLFAILGLVHAVYTLADISRPRRLVPDDPAVIAAMSSSGLRLARGGTTMWRAWVGFNFSHSLGIATFGVACIVVGLSWQSLALPKAALLVPVAIGVTYFLLAIRYWFRASAIGVAAGTLCFVIGWLLY